MIIGDDTRALQKDRWKFADCLGLSTKMYKELLGDHCCLRWFCEDCDMLVMDTGRNPAGYDSASSTDRIYKLVVAV